MDTKEAIELLWVKKREDPNAYVTIDSIYTMLYGNSKRDTVHRKQNIREHINDLKKSGIKICYKYRNGKGGFRLSDEYNAQNNPFYIFRKDYSIRRADFETELLKDMPYDWISNRTKKKVHPSRKILQSDRIMNLNHISILPDLLFAIKNKRPLKFSYNTKYRKVTEVYLHPAFLKEFSGRWYVCGIVSDEEGNTVNKQGERTDGENMYQVYAIDRIERFEIVQNVELTYIKSEENYWTEYFAPLYGIWHNHTEPKEIIFETQNLTTYYRLRTKPIHSSQMEIQPMDENEKARFSIKVIPNRELTSLLMSYREKIKIIGPEEYLKEFIKSLHATLDLYDTGSTTNSSCD